ncbi:hypothetical protein GCK32_010207 [Trichostrongylus colubriformis]|uniref:Uncharacterized protein n=1 Tax=Trichostrongylus colubriformis TaxID=6319 RepID=A0AAN8F2Z7_TRICO
MEGLAMVHESYKLLILAKAATMKSRQEFYDTDVKGASIERAFIVTYRRMEVDFFDEVQRSIEGEMKNAEIQLSLEQYTNPMAELMEIVGGFCKAMTKSKHFQQEVEK